MPLVYLLFACICVYYVCVVLNLLFDWLFGWFPLYFGFTLVWRCLFVVFDFLLIVVLVVLLAWDVGCIWVFVFCLCFILLVVCLLFAYMIVTWMFVYFMFGTSCFAYWLVLFCVVLFGFWVWSCCLQLILIWCCCLLFWDDLRLFFGLKCFNCFFVWVLLMGLLVWYLIFGLLDVDCD